MFGPLCLQTEVNFHFEEEERKLKGGAGTGDCRDTVGALLGLSAWFSAAFWGSAVQLYSAGSKQGEQKTRAKKTAKSEPWQPHTEGGEERQ